MSNIESIIYNHLKNGLYKNGNRSSKRTDEFHTDILNIIIQNVDNFHSKYNVFFEKPIKDVYGKKFKIDILIEDKIGNIVVCILLKAFISCVGKNKYNNANTTLGEIIRIKATDGRENVKVWFITLISNKTPIYKKDNSLRGIDNIKSSYIDFNSLNGNLNNMLSQNTIDSVFYTTIKYDLLNIDYSSKGTFLNSLKKQNIKATEDKLINNAKTIL